MLSLSALTEEKQILDRIITRLASGKKSLDQIIKDQAQTTHTIDITLEATSTVKMWMNARSMREGRERIEAVSDVAWGELLVFSLVRTVY
jgi:hypothetical protein